MGNTKQSRRWAAVACAITLLLSLGACGKTAETPLTPGAEAPEVSAPPSDEAALFGAPWIDSLLAENLPSQAPEAKDDLYLHCNFEMMAEHAGTYFVQAYANPTEITDFALGIMEDETRQDAPDGAYTREELSQLRLFFRMAEDLEARSEAGLTELEPYLLRILNAKTLPELNRVLVSEDFPFSPYLYFLVSAYDMSGVNNVFVYPEFLFVDNMSGAEYLQSSDDPAVQQANLTMITETSPYILLDLLWLGVPQDQALDTLEAVYALEESYGRSAPYNDRYIDQPFGAFGASYVNLSLDELAALCPNFPVKETVVKFGKDASPFFTVQEAGWLRAFNEVWTEENLETLKIMTTVKLLRECEPCLDAAVYAPAREILGIPEPDGRSSAVELCARPDTFGPLLGKIYVEEHYSDGEIARLTELADTLIDAFRQLIRDTDWLGEASREAMLRKLDTMRLNVAYPDGGYPDLSDLSLTAAEDGGSLLGNYFKLKAWYNEKQNQRLGRRALATSPWDQFSPTSAGCYYDFDTNSINIMPGYLASQGYGAQTSREELLGAYGWIIGHEISHAFDFAGAQFDADGIGRGVLDPADLDTYLSIVDRLSACYDAVEALPGVQVEGERVKTEAAADLIGMQLALTAAKELPDFDYQAFFSSAAHYMFMSLPNRDYVQYYLADEHPLHYLRVNINAQMYPDFYEAFGVAEGDGMYRPEEQRVRFWGE